MYGYLMEFNSLPAIGFAIHCKMPHYIQDFTPDQEGVEVVYVKSGTITVEYLENKWLAPPGSLLILKRDLPFLLYTQNNETNEHSSIQLLADFKITVTKDIDSDSVSEKDALALPFIIQPCEQNELVMKKMNSIISDAGSFFESSRMNRSVALVSLLYDINKVWKSQRRINEKSPSILCYKIRKLILNHGDEDITLDFIANKIGKTPNYLNHVFKEETGMTIHQFILKEKVRIICELILSRALPFRDACNTVGIHDIAYGYRLFKRQTGLTPGEFAKGKTHRK